MIVNDNQDKSDIDNHNDKMLIKDDNGNDIDGNNIDNDKHSCE